MGLDKRGKSKEFLDGYRDGVNATWDEVQKMSAQGYSPQEFKIMISSKRFHMLKEIDPGMPSPDARPAQQRSEQPKDEEPKLVPGTSYLVKELKPDGSYALFAYAIKTGMKGYCIARTHPETVKTKYRIPNAKIVWLVSEGGGESMSLPPSALGLSGDAGGEPDSSTVAPDKLPWIFTMTKNFMDGNAGKGAVILDGLEYLIAQNTFKSVLSFVQGLNEAATSTKCVLIIPVSPTTMEPKEFAQLEREMGETVDGSG